MDSADGQEVELDSVSIETEATPSSKLLPESPAEVRTRRWIVLSLWAIVALLGLPAWYATTTVPRADLPLYAMNQWADGQVCNVFSWFRH